MAKKKATKPKRPAKKKVAKKTTRGGGQSSDERRSDGTFKGPNATSWKPGQSGNPKGRPRTTLLSTAYKRWLGEDCFDKALIAHVGLDPSKTWSWADVISLGMVKAAIAGKTTAAKEIRESTEGSTLAIKPDWQGVLKDMGVDPEEALKTLVNEMDLNTTKEDS